MTVASPTRQCDSWDAARAIARVDFGSCDRNEGTEPVTPRDGEWAELLTVLATQRLSGVALLAADNGVLELTAEQYDQLFEQHEMQLALDLRVERLVLAAFEALSTAGIGALLLKGPSMARRFYDDPSLRSFGDADILVRRHDFRRAVDTLEDLGCSRRTTPPRPWFDRYVKAACFTTDDGLELDLHQLLAPGPYGFIIDTDGLFDAEPDAVRIGHVSIPCLPAPPAFVHACAHAALGDPYPRLASLRDIVAVLRAEPSDVAVAELVAAWQLEPVIARSLSLVERVLGCRPRSPIAARYRYCELSRRDRWRMSAYESDRSRFARQSAAAFWELPSIRDKVAYAAALAFPRDDYVRARATTYPRRLRDAASLALKWRPH